MCHAPRGEMVAARIRSLASLRRVNGAPQKVTRTAVEAYLHSIAPPIHRTKEEATRAAARRDLVAARQSGDVAAVQASMETGQFTRRSVLLAARSARLNALQRAFEPTTLSHAIHAYELATPEERGELQPLFARKYHNLLPNVARDDRLRMIQQFGTAMKLPVTRPALVGT